MTGRRTFIKKSVVTLAATTFGNLAFSETNFKNKKEANHKSDEDFWKIVRANFPLTDKRTYLNNGTIGPSPFPVLDAVRSKMEYLSEIGEYKGQEDSREPIAGLLGVTPEEISLTHNTTEGINIVAAGLPLGSGDEVIMTTHEHVGNALPWLNQKKYKGFRIRVFDPGPTMDDNLNHISDLITSKTKVIAIPHITCTTGHKFPVKEVVKLAKDKGIWTFFDGAHGPGSIQLDLNSYGCDFYASCGHKWLLGPSGTGFLYVNNDSLEILEPNAVGAYSDSGWEISSTRQEMMGYVNTAHRFDYGTQSAPLSNGLKAAVGFMEEIGMDKIEPYIKSLATGLYNQLLDLGSKVEVLSPPEEESRSSMITFKIPGVNYREFGKRASENKFRIRLVPESGLEAIRISTHLYNNEDDIEKFVQIVASSLD